MGEKDHSCYHAVEKLEYSDGPNDERMEAEGKCSVCGEKIKVSYIADYYTSEDGETTYLK